jgi:hypothetical protein
MSVSCTLSVPSLAVADGKEVATTVRFTSVSVILCETKREKSRLFDFVVQRQLSRALKLNKASKQASVLRGGFFVKSVLCAPPFTLCGEDQRAIIQE